MTEQDIRIVTLEPLHVASVLGFGAQPEDQAHAKLQAWAGPKGYFDDLAHHRIFGFNNPSPSPASPNYGYELWITVDAAVEADGDIEIKDFPGGLYAVARCKVEGDPYQAIPAAWERLATWREHSRYRMGRHQWLEEHLRPEDRGVVDTPSGAWILDLYLPITQ